MAQAGMMYVELRGVFGFEEGRADAIELAAEDGTPEEGLESSGEVVEREDGTADALAGELGIAEEAAAVELPLPPALARIEEHCSVV